MPPLTGNGVAPLQQATFNHDTTADARSEDDAKDHGIPLSGAITGFRQRKAIRIIRHPNGPSQEPFQIFSQRLIIQAHRIRIFDASRQARYRTWCPNAKAS
jgi:hypothetical protein